MKKHIIITGSRGSGKTTLLKDLAKKLGLEETIPGIITWSEPGKAVYMQKLGCEEYAIIGRFNPKSQSKENRMTPVVNGFEGYGIDSINQLMSENSEWVMIDEIGYLEASSSKYLEKLNELLDTKRVALVIRKQDLEHINSILKRNDAEIIDLDIDKPNCIWD